MAFFLNKKGHCITSFCLNDCFSVFFLPKKPVRIGEAPGHDEVVRKLRVTLFTACHCTEKKGTVKQDSMESIEEGYSKRC